MLQISAGRTARNTGILPPVWYAHILERNNRDAGEAAAEIASIMGNFEAGDNWQARYSAAVHCSRTQLSAVHSERQRSNR